LKWSGIFSGILIDQFHIEYFDARNEVWRVASGRSFSSAE